MSRKNKNRRKNKTAHVKTATAKHNTPDVIKTLSASNIPEGGFDEKNNTAIKEESLKDYIPFLVPILIALGGWLDLYNNAVTIPLWLTFTITLAMIIYCFGLFFRHLLNRKKLFAGAAILLALWMPRGLDSLSPNRGSVEQSQPPVGVLRKLDLSRMVLTDISVSLKSKDDGAYTLVRRLLSIPFKLHTFSFDPEFKKCWEADQPDSSCVYTIRRAKEDFELGIKYSSRDPQGKPTQENNQGLLIKNIDWSLIERSLKFGVFRSLKILDEAGNNLVAVEDILSNAQITLFDGNVSLKINNPSIHLDQLYEAKIKFQMTGPIVEVFPDVITLKTDDPRIKLNQDFKIDWKTVQTVQPSFYEANIQRGKGTGITAISLPQPLRVNYTSP